MNFFETPQEEIIKRIRRMDNYEKGNEEILFWAAINGHNDIIQNLIEVNKSNPGKFPLKFNKHFNLALRYAAMHEHILTIDLLFKAGADEPDPDFYNTIDKKLSNKLKKIIIKYRSLAPGCIDYPERYNYLLLDWLMDNCSPSIFNKLKEHIETKNSDFTYTERPRHPETGLYMSRWKVKKNKRSKAVK